MKNYRMLFVGCLLSVLGTGLPIAWGQGAPVITSPHDGDTAYFGGQVTLQCSGGYPPLTWSGSGSFLPSTGNQVTWTVPTSGASATATVTDACGNSDSVTVHLANIIYVDKDRPGGDGSSWANAFKYLQDALAAAGSGCEIWVAEGTYYPDEDKSDPNGARDCYRAFVLVPGAGLYGGFVGNETTRSDTRDRLAHETILSGDLHRSTPPTLDAGNSYRVVTCSAGTATTVLDGFTVTMGYSAYDGTGISLTNCSPTITNCLIMLNRSLGNDGDGGGMHCFRASPTVTNCVFQDNHAGDDGGGLCNKNGSNGVFTNCVFYRNHTDGGESASHGGGIFNTRGEPADYIGCTPTFTNCVVVGNDTAARGDGGGAADNGADVHVTWINCTFYGNHSADDGGGLATRDGAASTVTNCIFWGNTAGGNGAQLWQGGTPAGTATVTYSDVQDGFTGTGNINSDPLFFAAGDPDGADNRFLTADDGLEIDFGSPCIDTGTGTGAPAFDATGRTRPLDGDENGSALHDPGAYEFESVVEKRPYLLYPGQTTTPNTTAQMTVLWQLTQTRTCTLEWGTTTAYGTSVQTNEINTDAWGHQHRYTMANLTPGTRYYYHVRGVGTGSLWTAPTPATTSTRFLVYSDTQGPDSGGVAPYYDAVCARMVASYTPGSGDPNADPNCQTFALHCGDNVNYGCEEAGWRDEFFIRSRANAMSLLAHVPIQGCLGNHNLRAANGYHTESYYGTLLSNKYWSYPFVEPNTSYWSFDYGPVHVAVVDQYVTGTYSGSNRVGAAQLAWLKEDLRTTDREWKFVILHETGYAGTGTNGTAYQEVRNTLQPVFDQNDVDIVFAGHEHYYCHAARDGVAHVTTGGGGGGLGSCTAAAWHVAPNPASDGQRHHFCRVTIDGDVNRLTLEAIDRNGTQIEKFTIQH